MSDLLRNATVLLVEDDEPSAELLSRRLQKAGMDVQVVGDGPTALSRLAVRLPDLVLLDWHLPGMNGTEVLREIRALHPPEVLPVVMVTAVADEDRIADALSEGASDYITKPVHFRLTLARLRIQMQLVVARRQLSDLAMQDALTGLANRRGLDEALYRSVRVGARHGLPVSVILFDLDHYKGINDTWGHAVGDDVLRHVSFVVRSSIRGTDLPARYGDDELCVVLPDADATSAMRVAERIRSSIAGLPIPNGKGGVISVTGSFGVATLAPGANAEDLMASADAALYASKRAGRNRVTSADEDLPDRAAATLELRGA